MTRRPTDSTPRQRRSEFRAAWVSALVGILVGNIRIVDAIGANAWSDEQCPTGIDVGVIITDGATANGVDDNEFNGPWAVPITIENPSSAELKGNKSASGAPVTAAPPPSAG